MRVATSRASQPERAGEMTLWNQPERAGEILSLNRLPAQGWMDRGLPLLSLRERGDNIVGSSTYSG